MVEKYLFFALSELRSVLRHSATVKLSTAKLPVSSSNDLLDDPRCLEMRKEKREVSQTKFLPEGKEYQQPTFSKVGALSMNVVFPQLRAILPFYSRRWNSRDDATTMRIYSF